MGKTTEMPHINNKFLDDKYEIIREIKKGGFGIVYYGIDRKLNKPIAIKEIAPNLLEDPKYMDMFQEEALNIAKLSHHNIVHIYELIKDDDGRLYIIMEYIDGIDLEKIIRRARKIGMKIPSHLAVYIIAEICMALDYAHQRRDAFTNKPLKLVHQDVSPSNIMISRDGGVKLIDFGIAMVRRHQTREKREKQLRGKIPYMAPEQLIMGNHPDHRSDLFSLGLVLYECLVGARLYNSREEAIAATKNGKWLKKSIKGKGIPSVLEKILSKLLETDLSKRYQSANHLYIDLLQYLISCDISGELMDYLADFINDLFVDEKFSETNNNIQSDLNAIFEEASQSDVPIPSESSHLDVKPRNTVFEPFPNVNSQNYFTDTIDSPDLDESSFGDREEEEDLKTEIDVIRISARNYKRRIINISIGVLITLITFGVLDTINGWTKVGISMYDWLFPPAIEILTVPANAEVFLDGKTIKGRTPISIDEISPGVHKLRLSLEGYKSIVKSLFVPRKGAIRVQGQADNGKSRSYLFRFNTDIEINSVPPGALVYLNGIRFNQKTPCSVSWEVGAPLSIEMEHHGFEHLSGYSLNTINSYDEVEDRRFWDSKVIKYPYMKYSVRGIFRKRIIIESIPVGAEIYTNESHGVLGVTGKNTTIFLTAGAHELILKKKNFIPKHIQLIIDENSNDKVRVVLSRKVHFTAFNEKDNSRKDIGANLVNLFQGRNNILLKGRQTTPFEMILPAYPYTAVFHKNGYQIKKVEVRPEAQVVRIEMRLTKAFVEIKVLDALTNLPINDAEISYNLIGKPQTVSSHFQYTTVTGEGFGEVVEGDYIFTVRKAGYKTSNKNLAARAGETYSLVFKIFPSN